MSKLVILELDGDLWEKGYRVTLEIGDDFHQSSQLVKRKGYLPANPGLANSLQFHWQEVYRNLEFTSRIKTKKIIYKGSIQQRIQDCQESALQLRDRFQLWLKSDTFRELDTCLREELNREENIRFLIRTEDAHIQKLPWQTWDFFSRYSQAEIALSPLESKLALTSVIKEKKTNIRILAILGDRAGIDTEKDLQILQQLPNTEIVFLVEPNHQQINAQLWEQVWDIIFFAGHSETQADTGRIYINSTDSLTLQELTYGLQKSAERGLKLAIFNSCDGLGLAKQLDDLKIPQMIVMREFVPDRIAQEFLKHFLQSFASGKSLYLAVREARQRLHDDFEREFPCASWLPIICQNPVAKPPTWEQLLNPFIEEIPNLPNIKQVSNPAFPSTPLAADWVRLVISLIITLLIFGLRSLGVFQYWEMQAFDALMRLRPHEGADPRLLVVEATEADINRYGFPLPDETLAQAISQLEKYQPRVMGLDIFRPQTTGNELSRQFQDNQRLIAVCSTRTPDNPNKPGIASPPSLPRDRLSFTDVVVDADGVLRRHLMFMTPSPDDPCLTNHALSSRVALRYLAETGIEPKTIAQDRIQIGQATFVDLEQSTGAYQNLDTRGFQPLLNYRAAQEVAQRVSLSEVIEDRLSEDWVKNRVVLVGVSAPISGDNFSTPYSLTSQGYERMPGVIVQAHMTSQILAAVLDGRPLLQVWHPGVEFLWIWVWAIAPIAFSGDTKLYRGIAIVLVSLPGISFVLLVQGIWVPLVPSILGAIATASSSLWRK